MAAMHSGTHRTCMSHHSTLWGTLSNVFSNESKIEFFIFAYKFFELPDNKDGISCPTPALQIFEVFV